MEASEILDRMRELELWLSGLDDEGRYLAEITGKEDKIARSHLIAIGRPECRELCETMYDKLPRELRDMVYKYVVDNYVDVTFKVSSSPWACNTSEYVPQSGPAFYPALHVCTHGICASHFLDSAYVCALVQREIAEAWLASRTFWFTCDWQNLPDLLNSDRWLTGQPAHRSISHIAITIGGISRSGEDIDVLKALTLLKPSARVTFHFDFTNLMRGEHLLLDRFEYTLCWLWPTIELLDQSRIRIDVEVDDFDDDESMIRLTGGTSIDGWLKLLEEVSLQYVCGL